MITAQSVQKELSKYSNNEKEEVFIRFFKTGRGEYGYGDKFWGITVSNIRDVAKRYYKDITFEEVKKLIESEIHEIRLTGYIIFTYRYEKGNTEERKNVYTFYINNLSGCNNWDIVDLSCSKIIGNYILDNPKQRDILYKLVKSNNLWEQRISIVSTYSLIRSNNFKDALRISKILLTHKHDLIHKAVGWMLREVGKRDIDVLRDFLNRNINNMPRTTLRYAIERMDKRERNRYLHL